MARRQKRRPDGPSGEDRTAALDRARVMAHYGLAVEVDPRWSREEVEAMTAAELREVLAARPDLPTAAMVEELVEVAEGRRLASVYWERHTGGPDEVATKP